MNPGEIYKFKYTEDEEDEYIYIRLLGQTCEVDGKKYQLGQPLGKEYAYYVNVAIIKSFTEDEKVKLL